MTPDEIREAADKIAAAGGEVAEQWGYMTTFQPGMLRGMDGNRNAEPVDRIMWVGREALREIIRAAKPGPPGELLRRLVITTPPEVVTVAEVR